VNYAVDLQIESENPTIPNQFLIQRWINEALQSRLEDAELTIRIVDEAESAELNLTYRNKQGPTNVLSFPADIPEEVELEKQLLGDLIICAPIVEREAKQQEKTSEAHWAHMVIHGTLHLLGYDHIEDKDADIMEGIEIKLLEQLGYPAPYER